MDSTQDKQTDAAGRAGELREDLKLELLDWQGDRISGAEDMPLEEIIELNSKSLDVTLDNIIKLLDSATRTAVTEERERILAGLPEYKEIKQDIYPYEEGELQGFNDGVDACRAVIAAGGKKS